MDWQPATGDYVDRVMNSFRRQTIMQSLGARLVDVRPGLVSIVAPFNGDFTQQHGFMHAGAITAIVDSACGYAAYSLMPPDTEVLTVEFKVNLLSPARGDQFIATGRVVKHGRTLTFCEGEVRAKSGDDERLIATMSTTMMSIRDRPDVRLT